jgi:type II secretory ATPase GspE/PulE/Tfp pilus assembly ATPase PilB-like protein
MVVGNGWIPVMAFLERAFGAAPRPKYGENLETRAQKYLVAQSGPPDSLKFRIALEQLRREYDLLDEESALLADCLALQVKLMQIASANSVAHKICEEAYVNAPVCRLLAALLSQANHDGAKRFDIRIKTDVIQVIFDIDGKAIEAMTIPKNLAAPLMGAIKRTEAVGYPAMCQFLYKHDDAPSEVNFDWISAVRCRIVLG